MGFFGKLGEAVQEASVALTRDAVVKKWLDEIDEAGKREKQFRQEAQRCVEIYEMTKSVSDQNTKSSYNILYANTETLAPALYNSTPRAVVQPKSKKEERPVAKLGAQALQGVLTYLLDTNDPNYTSFDDLQKSAVQEALVPGRGLTKFKYNPTIETVPPELPGGQPTEQLKDETICGDSVGWNRMLIGYAPKWAGVPWIGYEHFMTRAECVKNFGETLGNQIKLTAASKDDGDKNDKAPADAEGVKFAHIWEIWDKAAKKVIFVSDGHPNLIKEVDDPLGLQGFYNTPKPIIFLEKISSMVPQPLYLMYEKQAQELNEVTNRIGKITKALKIRGFYDSTIQGLDTLMTKEDNTLLPAANVAAMQQGQTLDKSIWLMPIEKLITVLQQLYLNRQQIIAVIHGLTGIADIMRGASQASETLGAQEIKQAWGTLRLKKMQKEVQRYARDSLRIMAEIAANKFSPETFAAMTSISLPTDQDKQQAKVFLEQARQAPPPMEGQPPAVDPAQLQQAQQTMSTPTWADVIAFLQNDLLRNYSIDIETNSTIDAEATEDKEQVAEFMNALGQLLNGLAPLVEKGFMPFEAAKALILSVTKRFRFGIEVEDALKAMQPPAPPEGGDPKAAAEAAALQQQMEHDKQVNALKLEGMKMDQGLTQAKNNAELEKIRLLGIVGRARATAELKKLGMDVHVAEIQADATEDIAAARVRAANAPKPAPAGAA